MSNYWLDLAEIQEEVEGKRHERSSPDEVLARAKKSHSQWQEDQARGSALIKEFWSMAKPRGMEPDPNHVREYNLQMKEKNKHLWAEFVAVHLTSAKDRSACGSTFDAAHRDFYAAAERRLNKGSSAAEINASTKRALNDLRAQFPWPDKAWDAEKKQMTKEAADKLQLEWGNLINKYYPPELPWHKEE